MARQILRLLPAISAFLFALLAFIFCVLAISSREWAVRDAYNRLAEVWMWHTPIFTLYRSPFSVCYATANATGDTARIGWNVTCTNYRAFGFDQTSCELGIATGDDTSPQYGDQRLCQQIHYAGNFGITSVVFITFGFMLISLLTLVTIATVFPGDSPSGHSSASKNEEAKAITPEKATADTDRIEISKANNERHHRHQRSKRSSIAPYINLFSLTALFIGAVAALICQFYAVEGLVQSAPNNADFAGTAGTSSDDVNTKGNHGPWYQGKALSVYMTCAWGFAVAAGVVASKAWKLPRWDMAL